MSLASPGVGQSFPLSYAQQRLWFLHEWDPGAGSYGFPVNARITGKLDTDALERSLVDIVDRHWSLRSAIGNQHGTPAQVVAPNRFRLVHEDLRGLDETARRQVLGERVESEATRPFDFSAGLLVRGRLLALADDEHVLMLTFHHIVFDGWSSNVLADELDAHYRRHTGQGIDERPPALEMQCGEYARWEAEAHATDRFRKQADYWRSRLEPLPPYLALPTEFPRPDALSGRTDRAWLPLSVELTERVGQLARSHRATPYMVLMAAYQALLWQYSGQADFCVGGASAGRVIPETHPLIGTFVNEVVYRSDCAPGQTFAELLAAVRRNALDAYRHDRFPFERLVELVSPRRSVSHHPLFQHSLVLQPGRTEGEGGLRLAGLEVTGFETGSEGSALDVAVSFHSDTGRLVCAVDVSTDLYTREWAEEFADGMLATLEAMTDDPEQSVQARMPAPTAEPFLEPVPEPVPAPVSAPVSPPVPAPVEDDLAAAERALTEIWRRVLRDDTLGVDDNFFDSGGDSMLGLQVVAMAQAAGLDIRVRHLFQHQTIAEMAAAAPRIAPVTGPERPEGSAPLLPVQSWFLSADDADSGHFNYTNLYRIAGLVDDDRLRAAIQAAFTGHDAVRLRFERTADGGWRQYYVDDDGFAPMETVDLTDVDPAEREQRIVEVAIGHQAALRLDGGPLIRAVHLVLAPDDHRLMVAAHHLIMDVASANIVADDITTAYRQLTDGEPLRLLTPRSTFQQWGLALAELADSELIRAEIPYWRRVLDSPDTELPVQHGDGVNDVASQRTDDFHQDPEHTRTLRFGTVPEQDVTVNEILLTALGGALGDWAGGSVGGQGLLIDMEMHGRDDIVDGVDVSRTVGWFSAMYPLALPTGDAARGQAGLRRFREAYRELPRNGIGYGVLSGMSDALPARSGALAFTYVGVLESGYGRAEPFLTLDGLPPTTDRQLTMRRRHEIEVVAGVQDDRMWFSLTYSTNRYTPDRVRALGDGILRELRVLTSAPGPAARPAGPSLADSVEAIRQLKHRYWRSCDTRDLTAMRACFADGPVDIVYGTTGIFATADGLVASYEDAYELADRAGGGIHESHHGYHPVISLRGPTEAVGEWSVEYRRINPHDRTETVSVGEYRDAYRLDGGEWRITSCHYTTRWQLTRPLAADAHVE